MVRLRSGLRLGGAVILKFSRVVSLPVFDVAKNCVFVHLTGARAEVPARTQVLAPVTLLQLKTRPAACGLKGLSCTAPTSREPTAEARSQACGCDQVTPIPARSQLPVPGRLAAADPVSGLQSLFAEPCTGTSSPRLHGTSRPKPSVRSCDTLGLTASFRGLCSECANPYGL